MIHPRFERSTALQNRLHDLVPGGAHTYSRGSDQYPEGMAPVLVRGRGARVWDVDGNEFVEYGMGLRSVTLGHGFKPVLDAVRAVLDDGLSFTRPTRLELAAAEDLLSLVPAAEMVKFAKNGSDVTTAAVRLARAATGRDLVAVCADHPFFSVDDWFIGTTAMRTGIPAAVRDLTVSFPYNDLAALRELFAVHDGRIAAVVLEPATALAEPVPGYLAGVRELCDTQGAVLVFDEMITGFRWAVGGGQALYGVSPDLSTWGKAMGNGFPISALAGRRDLMELGGLRTDADRVFLLSTTHGPETASLAAFRAVVAAYRETDPVATMDHQGARLAVAVTEAVHAEGVADHVQVLGRASCLLFRTLDAEGQPSQPLRTLFLAGLLGNGVLGQSFVISAAHDDADIERTATAVGAAAARYRRALDAGSVDGLLIGQPVAPALRTRAEPRRLPP